MPTSSLSRDHPPRHQDRLADLIDEFGYRIDIGDELPPNPNPPIITDPEPDDEPVESANCASPESREPFKSTVFCTETNSFGIYRKYAALGLPTITPDESFMLSSVSDTISIARDPADSRSNASWWSSFSSSSLESVEKVAPDYFAPFFNPSTFLLMSWYCNGSSIKSYADVDKLIHNVIRHEDLQASDFEPTFSTARQAQRMDKNQPSTSSTQFDNFESLPSKPPNLKMDGSRAAYQYLYRAMDANSARKQMHHDL